MVLKLVVMNVSRIECLLSDSQSTILRVHFYSYSNCLLHRETKLIRSIYCVFFLDFKWLPSLDMPMVKTFPMMNVSRFKCLFLDMLLRVHSHSYSYRLQRREPACWWFGLGPRPDRLSLLSNNHNSEQASSHKNKIPTTKQSK
jgi:hypothetical protein